MNTIALSVANRIVTKSSGRDPVQGGVEADKVTCTFDSEWDDLTITATFQGAGDPVEVEFDPDSYAYVPWECLQEPGLLFIGFAGRDDDSLVVRTKTMDPIAIQPGEPLDGVEATDPTRDIIGQCLKATEGAENVDASLSGYVLTVTDRDGNETSKNVRGAQGEAGQGVPTGGTTGQVLAKKSATDYDTEWVDQTGGGAGVWGQITGTLSNQADLQSALDAKAGMSTGTSAPTAYTTGTVGGFYFDAANKKLYKCVAVHASMSDLTLAKGDISVHFDTITSETTAQAIYHKVGTLPTSGDGLEITNWPLYRMRSNYQHFAKTNGEGFIQINDGSVYRFVPSVSSNNDYMIEYSPYTNTIWSNASVSPEIRTCLLASASTISLPIYYRASYNHYEYGSLIGTWVNGGFELADQSWSATSTSTSYTYTWKEIPFSDAMATAISTAVSTHNSASDAHPALFNAKQDALSLSIVNGKLCITYEEA